MIQISAYRPYTNKEGKTTAGCIPYDSTLESEIKDIQSAKHKTLIETLRNITDDDEKRTFKATNLPCFTVSAICKDWRNSENIVNHTGLICIDIDKHNNEHVEDWAELRDKLFDNGKSIVAAFISASGHGLAIIFKVLPNHHLQVFNTIVGELNLLGIKVDIQCKDVVRVRYSSVDEGARLRDYQSVEYALPSEKFNQVHEPKIEYKHSKNVNSIKTFNHAIENANKWGEFTDGYKHHYLLRVAAYCNLVGMDEDLCKGFVIDTFASSTSIAHKDLIKPISLTYRAYKSQFSTQEIPPPLYTFKQIKWLLTYVKKDLLKSKIEDFGRDTYEGQKDIFTVESKLLCFFMHLIAPDYTWTTRETKKTYPTQKIKQIIPENAILDSCNGTRIWVSKVNLYPLNW